MRGYFDRDKEKYDEALLPLFDSFLPHSSNKAFYLLHLLGTHTNYKRRFPKNFTVFTSSNETGNGPKEKQLRADYDDAILYNDFIIDKIIQRVENKTALVLYVSDHADSVYDDPEGKSFGHDSIHPNRYMFEIPMLVWASRDFVKQYPHLMDRIASSIHRPYMTDDLIHTILDMLDISTPDYDPKRSIIHPDFDSSRKRITGGIEYPPKADTNG